MQARLKVLHDKANVKQVKLLPVTLIGRSTDCNLKIASSQVSRNHCRITLGEDAVFVEDLGSANGTLVDGQLLAAHQPTAIAPGARLVVGPAEFQIDFVAPTSATFVMPRMGVPHPPEMPSTEMIFPMSVPFAASEMAADPTFATPVEPLVMPPRNPDPAVFEMPPAVIAKTTVVAPAAQSAAEICPSAVEVPRPAQTSNAEFVDQGFGFTESAEADQDDNQPTEFLFGETLPDAPVVADFSSPSQPETSKKGLKSLFSLFGRKEKAAVAATHQATIPQSASAAPSVFLPTMDAEARAVETEEAIAIDASGEVASSSTETIEITGAEVPLTSSDEDDGFTQFLSQL